jgi:hypothetical protein
VVWKSLIEHSLVRFVDVGKTGDDDEATVKPPQWWTFNDHD